MDNKRLRKLWTEKWKEKKILIKTRREMKQKRKTVTEAESDGET